jgi:hypothetical protein
MALREKPVKQRTIVGVLDAVEVDTQDEDNKILGVAPA